MKETRLIMGMPITVEIADSKAGQADLDAVFDYFTEVDERFSTYKAGSEISRINRGELQERGYSPDMREVLKLSEETKRATGGYFDIRKPDGSLDPSGLVKGWAIRRAAELLAQRGFWQFFVDAGGDIEARGKSWKVGIKNPFEQDKIVKTVIVKNAGIATSGSYIRGAHIYNPHAPEAPLEEIVSLTVIGPNVYEADRFATAAFAMGKKGIEFIEKISGLEGYAINAAGIATMTSDFNHYVA